MVRTARRTVIGSKRAKFPGAKLSSQYVRLRKKQGVIKHSCGGTRESPLSLESIRKARPFRERAGRFIFNYDDDDETALFSILDRRSLSPTTV